MLSVVVLSMETLQLASVGAKNKNEIIIIIIIIIIITIIIIISIISNSIVNWKAVLTSGGVELGQVVIRRGIFEGDSLSRSLL